MVDFEKKNENHGSMLRLINLILQEALIEKSGSYGSGERGGHLTGTLVRIIFYEK